MNVQQFRTTVAFRGKSGMYAGRFSKHELCTRRDNEKIHEKNAGAHVSTNASCCHNPPADGAALRHIAAQSITLHASARFIIALAFLHFYFRN